MSRPSLARLAALTAAVVAGMALVACGGAGSDPAATAPSGTTATVPSGTTATSPAPVTVTVYFPDDAGALVAETRPVPGGSSPLDAAMRALAQGPSAPELLPALPPGTRVLGTAATGAVATVDLSAELEAGYPSGGSAAELALVAPLVRTAAEASGSPRVRILVEGRAPAPAAGQLDLSEPLSPADVAAGG
jgi:spore germination protein GerM